LFVSNPLPAAGKQIENPKSQMIIDTHAHLNHPSLIENIEEVLDRARKANIEFIIVPATNYQTSLDVLELVQKYDMLYAALGIHPTELHDFHENHLHEIDKLAKSEKVVAIGEIGLDYYWKPYDKDLEQYVLKSQIQIAKNNNLPVVIHNRDSSEDLLNIITQEFERGSFSGQFHSFTGDLEMAKKCIGMGFYISFTGNITYKPNEKTLIAYEIAKNSPISNLLLETDSPYLPPVPYRGKQNEPAYLVHTADKIAQLKKIDLKELGRETTENAKRLFDI
jgi:TatD DNase family protein